MADTTLRLLALFLLLVPVPRAAPPLAGARAEDLPAGVVARFGDETLTEEDFQRYLGRIYARQPAGDEALRQLLVEALVRHASTALQVTVGDEEIDVILDDLERRAREATGGQMGLVDSLGEGRTLDDLREQVRLLALQKAVLRVEGGLPPDAEIDDVEVATWIEEQLAASQLVQQPLDSRTAATWAHGRIDRVTLGRRIEQTLSEEELSGALTELIGIRLIGRKAAAMGFSYTPESGAREISDREFLLSGNQPIPGVSLEYAEIVAQTQRRTIEELMESPRFQAEVLLRDMVEARWTEEQVRDVYEKERDVFAERYGPDTTFESVSHAVWREVRQRTYQQLFRESTIARRY